MIVNGKNMTGSAFLAYTRGLKKDERDHGVTLTETDQWHVSLAIEVFGPEYFYMDGEL